jgi:hypothetical protein
MASVRKVLNLYPTLEQTGLEFGSDYVFFLDSTVARFWFPNAEARAVVREALGRVSDGWVLGEQALERYGLAGAPSRLGELYYVVPGGTVLFPNFFQATAPPKGMHGYVPEVEENWARVIVRGAGARGELPRPVDLADVFPVMAELLDLPVPPACQGCSFLRSGNAD